MDQKGKTKQKEEKKTVAFIFSGSSCVRVGEISRGRTSTNASMSMCDFSFLDDCAYECECECEGGCVNDFFLMVFWARVLHAGARVFCA